MIDSNSLQAWVQSFPGMVTVCDPAGVILAMNDAAIRAFASSGGAALIGSNALDCHPEPSRTKMVELLKTRATNVYTTEKNGVHRLIYQCPWQKDGQYAGLVEIVVEIPAAMPHFVRGEHGKSEANPI